MKRNFKVIFIFLGLKWYAFSANNKGVAINSFYSNNKYKKHFVIYSVYKAIDIQHYVISCGPHCEKISFCYN